MTDQTAPAETAPARKSVLPMVLTIARMLAGPVVAALVLWGGAEAYLDRALAALIYMGTAVLFAAAALTDWLDGHLARKLNAASPLGAALDHAADKVLVTFALVALAYAALSMPLVIAAAIILGRDVAVAGLREGLSNSGRELPVSFAGKLKTAAEMIAVTAVLVSQAAGLLAETPVYLFFGLSWLASGALWSAALLALWSGAAYAIAAARPAPAPRP